MVPPAGEEDTETWVLSSEPGIFRGFSEHLGLLSGGSSRTELPESGKKQSGLEVKRLTSELDCLGSNVVPATAVWL